MSRKTTPRLVAEAMVADVMREAKRRHWSPGRTRLALLRCRESFIGRFVDDGAEDLGLGRSLGHWYRAALYVLGGHIRRIPDLRQLLLQGLDR